MTSMWPARARWSCPANTWKSSSRSADHPRGDLRGDLGQRPHHEVPLPVMRVRDLQFGLVYYTLSVEHDVEIDQARTPAVARHPAHTAFQLLERFQERLRFQLGTDLGDCVEIPRLLGYAPWLRAHEGGHAYDPGLR